MTLTLNEGVMGEILQSPDGMLGVWLTQKAVDVETAAKRLVNVDNGRLKGSITHIVSVVDGELVAWVGSNVEYALYQELEVGDTFPSWADPYGGSTRVRPGGKPYLRPALHQVMGTINR